MNEIQKTSNEITQISPDNSSDLEKFVTESLAEDAPKSHPNCKLCNSKYRFQAEEMFEVENRSARAIFHWLKEQNEDMSYGSVHNHMNHHFKVMRGAAELKALSKKITKWNKLDKSDESILNGIITSLTMEYYNLQASNASVSVFEQRKNIEVMLKIADNIKSCKKQLYEMKAQQTPVQIFYSTLHKVVEVKLSNLQDPAIKKALFEVLEMMEKEIGDVKIEGFKV
jgi:hypothetical protein